MNLKSNTPLTNKKSKQAFAVKDIVICGLFAAVLLVTQVALAVLPNIELVSLLIIVYTLVFGKKTIPIIYIFALLEGLLYGFGIWWVMYLYVWTILYFIVRLFRQSESSLFWGVVGGFFWTELWNIMFDSICRCRWHRCRTGMVDTRHSL